jgi:hypothetical protein
VILKDCFSITYRSTGEAAVCTEGQRHQGRRVAWCIVERLPGNCIFSALLVDSHRSFQPITLVKRFAEGVMQHCRCNSLLQHGYHFVPAPARMQTAMRAFIINFQLPLRTAAPCAFTLPHIFTHCSSPEAAQNSFTLCPVSAVQAVLPGW